MLLDDAESELLKKWIVKKLEAISDADSDVLADYVLALVKTEDPEPIAKTNCVDNLKDFLLDSTEAFVNDLFSAISSKSFDPNRPPPKPAAAIYQPPKRPSFEQRQFPNESKKRSYHDWDREAEPNGQIQSYQSAERPMKQPRRGGRGYEHREGRQSQTPNNYGMPSMPQLITPPPGMPPIDPNNPLAALLAMQQAMGFLPGMPTGGSPSNGNAFSMPTGAQRCRDYDTKGFCAAGASCPYDHGDPYVIPGFNQEYDPNNATLLNVAPTRVGHVNTSSNDRGRGGMRGRGRGAGNWRGGGKRADFSQVGPNRDKSITSIVIEQIPEDKLDEQTVRDFFAEFGNMEEVILQSEKKLAIVKYDSNEAARAAYSSPKVVFDNRFVKVYWYKPERIAELAKSQNQVAEVDQTGEESEMKYEDQLDLNEIAKRQEEAQRKHDEAKKQREEALKQKQDLDAKLKAMDADRKKMADLLAKKSGKAASPTTESHNAEGAEETEQTKALKAQLARLEAEAKSLGIDPEAPTNGFSSPTSYRGRGGYRGRGRGRGFNPGYRGGWAGAGGRGGAVMRLDNRSKTVAITFPDGSYESHDEALRQFLLFNSLDSATIAKHPGREDTAVVTFSQRYEGENFMTAANNSGLPHVGKVELSWYQAGADPDLTNGHHDNGIKMQSSDSYDDLKMEIRTESYETADEEDLDRWS